MKQTRIHQFVGDQLSRWPLACDNFRALKAVKIRHMSIGGLEVKLQFNPARMISSAAKLSKEDIAARKCFLCRENRPAEQIMMKFEGRKGKKYHILVNPYPIFPDHLVVAMDRHVEQSIWKRYVDMLDLARKYTGYTFFYNGPKSGASAPDHHHFQGAPSGLMPLENDIDALVRTDSPVLSYLTSVQDAKLYHYSRFTTGIFVLRAETAKSAAKLFYRLLDCANTPEGENEPLINLFSAYKDGEFRSIIVFRRSHRSHHYFSDGPDHLTMSPGCADMGGVFIVPVQKEFETIDEHLLGEMVSEVSIPQQEQECIIDRLTRVQPLLEVGIMSAKEIEFEILSDGAGARKAILKEGKIEYDGALYDELFFEAQTPSTQFAQPSFILHNVRIAKDFHWQRNENQQFAGALRIFVSEGNLTAVNIVGVEDYLLSVISSEMSATSSLELLKAHAVISRSWVMSCIKAARSGNPVKPPVYVDNVPSLVSDLDAAFHKGMQSRDGDVVRYVKWYDHQQHKLFDVCADDHCQRYQGLSRAEGKAVRQAIDSTWGQVLCYQGELCDTRFSKCCGGVMESFSTCWEDKQVPYLQPLADTPDHRDDLPCYCSEATPDILSQVLNNYDRETKDFYRWTVVVSRDELGGLVEEKSGVAVGKIIALNPLERGVSGRISLLEIVGQKRKLVVGKELEIRRLLSPSHLRSSAFEVEYEGENIILNGRGWGHGVGLCQIGAAVMASKGIDYESILQHYYPGAGITRL